VDAFILLTIVAASMTLAVMGARAMLQALLHVMAHPPALVRVRQSAAREASKP
jgi:hypothetical protein